MRLVSPSVYTSGENAMAFGRDGSELEISVLDLQVRVMESALRKIARRAGDGESALIARLALEESKKLLKRLYN